MQGGAYVPFPGATFPPWLLLVGAARPASQVAAIRRAEIPFGPFLALGALVYLVTGDGPWKAFLYRLGGGDGIPT